MYEVKENSRILKDGTEITTYIRDVVSCNILEVEAGTTGYCGGDTGHGGRTYFCRMQLAQIWKSIAIPLAAVVMVLKSASVVTAS